MLLPRNENYVNCPYAVLVPRLNSELQKSTRGVLHTHDKKDNRKEDSAVFIYVER